MLKRIMMTAAAFLMAAGTMLFGDQPQEIKPMDGVTKPSPITYISRNDYDDPVYFGDSTGGLYFCINEYEKVSTLYAAPVKRIVHCSNYMSDPLLGPIVYYNETDIDAKLNILYGSPITYSTMYGSTNIGPTCKFNDLACNGNGLYALNSNSDNKGCTIFKYSNKGGTADWLEGSIHPTDVFFVKLLSSEYDLFGITKDNKVYRIDFNNKKIDLLGYPKDTNSVACASNGALWLRNVVGDYYLPPGSSTWVKLANSCPLTDMACEPIFHYGRVWVAGRNGDIYATKCDTDQWELICNIPNVTCIGYNKYGQFFGASDGKIYFLKELDPPVTVNFVSTVPNYPGDAIYRITIQGAGLNQDQLFIQGLNGFSYNISAEGGSYAKDAYPITGLVYKSDNGTTASLTPGCISFLWKGPICARDGDHIVTISERINSNVGDSSNKLIGLNTWTFSLPKSESISTVGIGKIVFSNNGVTAKKIYPNGVCASEFGVQIQDGSGTKIPLINPLYNNLAFYVKDNASTNYDKLIGCNPLDEASNYWAIIPAEYVEIQGYPRYGEEPNKPSDYKRFYLFQSDKCDSINNDIVACLYGQDSPVSGKLTVSKTQIDSIKLSAACKLYPTSTNSNGGIYTIHLADNSGTQNVSDFMGTRDGNYYLDYALLNDVDNAHIKKGIFVVFPQGINRLQFYDRLNPAKMEVGYFMCPSLNKNMFEGGLEYQSDMNPDYCQSMQDMDIYACGFDVYGRYASGWILHTGTYSHPWDEGEISGQAADYRQRILAGNSSKVPICINVINSMRANPNDDNSKNPSYQGGADGNNTTNHNNFGMTELYKGVFFPPGKSERFGSRVHAILNQDVNLTYTYDYCFTGSNPFDRSNSDYLFQTYEHLEAQTQMTAWFTFNTVFSSVVPAVCTANAYLYEGKVASNHVRAYHIGTSYMLFPGFSKNTSTYFEDNKGGDRYSTAVYGNHAGERNWATGGLWWRW